MNRQKISFWLLIGIILLGGFFNKVIPINITILLVVLFVVINIIKKPKQNNILYVFYAFSFFFLLTPFYHEPILLNFVGYSHSQVEEFNPLASFSRLFGYILFAYAIAVFPIKENQFKYIWNSLMITSTMVALFCILEYYYGIKLYDAKQVDIVMQGVTRVRGPFGDPNASAGMILPGILILFTSVIYNKKRLIISLFILSFLFVGMSTTSSRTALVALLFSVSLFVFIKRKTLSRVRKSVLLFSLFTFGVTAIGFYLKSRELSFSTDSSGQVRLSLLNYAVDLMIESPIIGRGLNGGFHNIFADIGVSGGVLLLGLFIIFLWLILKRLWKSKNDKNAYILLSMLVGFLIVGLGISWINNVIFWLLIGFGMNKYFTTKRRKKYVNSFS